MRSVRQYVLNVSYILNQIVIQNGFSSDNYALILPSVLSNLAFALCVPFGPVLTRKFNVRRTYLTLSILFLAGSIVSALSPDMLVLVIGRLIQGISAGSLFLTILPVSLMSFPNRVRNWFLFLAVGALFGASSFGALLGSLSLNADAWRWLFWLCCLPPVFCYFVGYRILPKQQHHEHPHPVDKTGFAVLIGMGISIFIPLIHLEESGFASSYVWPFLVVFVALAVLFVIIELRVEHPLVYFRFIRLPKQISGVSMAASSHIGLILTLIGTSGFLRSIKNVPTGSLVLFYVWFIVGVIVTALLATWLYDLLGSGILGMAGSLTVIIVSACWRTQGADVSLAVLNTEMAFSGASVGLVLISGALATALAGDMHEARWRSVTLHFIRNFAGAMAAPIVAWFLYKATAIHYEHLRDQINIGNPQVTLQVSSLAQRFMEAGASGQQAQQLAYASILQQADTTSLLTSYHNLFTALLVVGIVMFASSVGMTVTGKSRPLVQKQQITEGNRVAHSVPSRVSITHLK